MVQNYMYSDLFEVAEEKRLLMNPQSTTKRLYSFSNQSNMHVHTDDY